MGISDLAGGGVATWYTKNLGNTLTVEIVRKIPGFHKLDGRTVAMGIKDSLRGVKPVIGSYKQAVLSAGTVTMHPETGMALATGYGIGGQLRNTSSGRRNKVVKNLIQELSADKKFLKKSYMARVMKDGLQRSMKNGRLPRKEVMKRAKLPLLAAVAVVKGVAKAGKFVTTPVHKPAKWVGNNVLAPIAKNVGKAYTKSNWSRGLAGKGPNQLGRFAAKIQVTSGATDMLDTVNAYGDLVRRRPVQAAKLGIAAYKVLGDEARHSVATAVGRGVRDFAAKKAVEYTPTIAVGAAGGVGIRAVRNRLRGDR